MEALSPLAFLLISNQKLCAKAWEPKDPNHPAIVELISKGMYERVDARCGFERLKDAMVRPTCLGLQVHGLICQK